MEVYILLSNNLMYGGRTTIHGVTASLVKARKWSSKKAQINEYEHTKYSFKTYEVE